MEKPYEFDERVVCGYATLKKLVKLSNYTSANNIRNSEFTTTHKAWVWLGVID